MDSEGTDAGIKVFAPERPHDQHGYPRCGTKTDRESESNNFNAQKQDGGVTITHLAPHLRAVTPKMKTSPHREQLWITSALSS